MRWLNICLRIDLVILVYFSSFLNIYYAFTIKSFVFTIFTTFLFQNVKDFDQLNLIRKSGMHEYQREGLIFLNCAARDWLSHAYPRPALEPIALYRTASDWSATPSGSHKNLHFKDGSPSVTQSFTAAEACSHDKTGVKMSQDPGVGAPLSAHEWAPLLNLWPWLLKFGT